MNSTMRTVVLDDCEIKYVLERKNVKNINLRIRKDGTVFVSANNLVPTDYIDNFVCIKSSYILNAIRKFEKLAQYKPQPKRYVSGETFYIQGRGIRLKVLESKKESIESDGIYILLKVKNPEDFEKKQRIVNKFINEKCKDVFGEIINEIYPVFKKYGVAMPTLRIRDMETRWGSCLPKKGVITINRRLIEAPRNCIEYVIMHEFCHFIYPNHSKSFYGFLTMLMPDWQVRKNLLENKDTYKMQ